MRRATVLAAAAAAVAVGAPLAPAQAQTVVTGTVQPAPAQGSGWLGIRSAAMVEVVSGVAAPRARLRIVDVFRGGPADRAGLRAGDEIVGLNGTPVSPDRFQELARRLQPGDPVSLTLLRDGRRTEVALSASARPGAEVLAPRQLQTVLDSTRTVFVKRLDSALHEIAATVTVDVPRFELRRIEADSVREIMVRTRGDEQWVRIRTTDGVFEWSAPRPSGDATASFRAWAFPGEGSATGNAVVVSGDTVRLVGPTPGDPPRPTRAPGSLTVTATPAPVRPLAPYLAGLNRVAGAEFTPLEGDLATYFQAEDGLLVTDVAQGTPAAEAGLVPGDVILSAGDRPVTSVDALRAALSLADGPVRLRVIRRGRQVDIRLPH